MIRTPLYLFLIVLIYSSFFALYASEADDSTRVITEKSKIDTLKLLSDQPVKSPWGAVLRSAVLPGWGQVYTHQYIKAGVVFTVNAALLWTVLDYHRQWKDTQNENYRDKRNQYTWYLGLAYLLTLVDAYVDASLFGFNEAMEITYVPPAQQQSAWMLTLQLKF